MFAAGPALLSADGGALSPASTTAWLKYPGNPVLGPGPAGSFDSKSVMSTAIVRYEGRYFLYYSGDGGSGYQVGLATSSDGRSFSRFAGNPIIRAGANASVIRDLSAFRMWYVGGSGVYAATSEDGRVWSEEAPGPVMAPGPSDGWDASIRSVNVLRDGDMYKMWYSAGKQEDAKIGYATSPDGVRWTKHARNPVLVPETSFESVRVHSPCVLRVGDEYQMWYSAYNGVSTRICFAGSADGIAWTRYPGNPLMPAGTQWESPSNLCPQVLFDGRDYRMYYTGGDEGLDTQIGCADSTTTGPAAPVPRYPPDNEWSALSKTTFNWSFGPAGYVQSAYQLQIDDSLDFGSLLEDTGKVASSEGAHISSEARPDGRYYWRVKAWNDGGEDSHWSAIRTVKIDSTPPAISTFIIENGAAFTTNRSVRCTLNASDPEPGSGLSGMRHKVNGADWTNWTAYRSAFTANLSGGDRLWTVTIEVRDRLNSTAPPANGSILVDTTPPPAASLRINDGAAFTGNRTVRLALSAADPLPGTGTSAMAFSSDGTAWTPWEPYCTTRSYDLPPGDGPRTVHVKVSDLAGNAGAPANASIILDSTPPATTLVRMPAVSETAVFTVSWTAQDALSGLAGIDIEYREGTGPWMPWLNGTLQTQAPFTGQDLRTYQFRSRSVDRVGNVEDFPGNATLSVRVVLPQPVVAILDPAPQKIIRGKYLAGGTAGHPKPGKAVTLVEVSVDGGPWLPAEGTLSWGFVLDTGKLKNGMHNITVRSFDGVKYSETAGTAFKVSNEPPATSTDYTPLLILVAVLVAAGGGASWWVLRGRGPRPENAPRKAAPPDTAEDGPEAPPGTPPPY
jgi:predicted GH43/DUF377 family glycosyl hydrolase